MYDMKYFISFCC